MAKGTRHCCIRILRPAAQSHDEFADTQRSSEERVAARDRGKAWALTSDLLLVGALAAGSFTAWWYLDISADEDGGERAQAVLVPYVDPEGGGSAVDLRSSRGRLIGSEVSVFDPARDKVECDHEDRECEELKVSRRG